MIKTTKALRLVGGVKLAMTVLVTVIALLLPGTATGAECKATTCADCIKCAQVDRAACSARLRCAAAPPAATATATSTKPPPAPVPCPPGQFSATGNLPCRKCGTGTAPNATRTECIKPPLTCGRNSHLSEGKCVCDDGKPLLCGACLDACPTGMVHVKGVCKDACGTHTSRNAETDVCEGAAPVTCGDGTVLDQSTMTCLPAPTKVWWGWPWWLLLIGAAIVAVIWLLWSRINRKPPPPPPPPAPVEGQPEEEKLAAAPPAGPKAALKGTSLGIGPGPASMPVAAPPARRRR